MDRAGATVLLVYSTGTVATMSKVFFFPSNRFVFFFFLLNIYINWHICCYTDMPNFTIYSQLLKCQFFTNRKKKKIWDCDQPQLKINVLRKFYNTYCYHNIFTIVEISIFYISNKKMLNPQHFNINFTTNHT